MAVQPTVTKLGAPNMPAALSVSIKNEYENIVRNHDFSKPITIKVKDVTGFDMIMNVIFTNVLID